MVMIKVAVTGASGFIGRYVLSELANHPVEIMAISRESDRKLPLLDNGCWVQFDIGKPPVNVFNLMNRPDVLIHLAWQGLPNYQSQHHVETELPSQYTFLKQVLSQGLKSLVVTGTCFEYGMQSGSLSEEDETRPDNPYGLAKNTLRQQLECLKAAHQFKLTWARLFYMYGDGQPSNSLWPQLKSAVEQGKAEFNMSGGEQLRDYLHVSKVARQLVALALKQQDIGVINLCSGKPLSVRSLVEAWIRRNNWNIELNLGYYPYPDYEPMAFWGESSKIKSLFESHE